MNLCNVPEALCQYWKVKEDLCTVDNLLLKGDRIVIPSSRRELVLKAIHEGHLGIEKCKARARICVYWSNLDDDIERMLDSVQCVTNTLEEIKTSLLNSNASVIFQSIPK